MVLIQCSVCKSDKFEYDASDSPHVDCLVILLLQNDYLGGSEPPRTNVTANAPLLIALFIHFFVQLWCYLGFHYILANLVFHNAISNPFRISATFSDKRLRHRSGEAKITQFHLTLGINEKIWWLNIPVNNVGGMAITHRTQHIINDGL